MAYVYLLQCSDKSLYCGWAKDLEQRVSVHNAGKGSKYTRCRLPVELVYQEKLSDKREAMSREYQIKKMSRKDKMALIG